MQADYRTYRSLVGYIREIPRQKNRGLTDGMIVNLFDTDYLGTIWYPRITLHVYTEMMTQAVIIKTRVLSIILYYKYMVTS